MTQSIFRSRVRAGAFAVLTLILCTFFSASPLLGADEKPNADKPGAAKTDAAKADVGKADAEKAKPEEPPLEIKISEQGVSVFAVGAQADELFTKLAQKTGVGVIVDDTVGRRDGDKFTSRKITLNLTNRKVSEIIAYICTAYGLSHTQAGNVFMISEGIPKNPSSYLMSDIDSVTTEYVLSSKAKSLLPEFLQADVKVNEGKNAVILSGPTEVLAKFRKDIKQFDVPAAQIMIDVLMVEFSESAGKELGFDFLWSNAGKGGSVSSGLGEIIFKSLGKLTQEFRATIKALAEKKLARVHANPRIATVSGQAASIFVGRQKYLREPVEMTGSGGVVNHIDAGITLNMTPWTGGDGEIIAQISPEVSVMSAPDAVTGLPERSTRSAKTEIRVHDGDTIVIGGLVQTEEQTTRTKIPLLGDLPIVGALFRGTNKSQSKTELVIFITPRIMSDKDVLTAQQKQEVLGK